MTITKLASLIVVGSALVAFGYSFGRDVYEATKRYWVLILMLALLAVSLYGLFVTGIWIARNYRIWLKRITKWIAPIVVSVGFWLVIVLVISFMSNTVSAFFGIVS